MATHLDLEEQEQLDQLKSFWNQHGNWISWVLIVGLLAYGGWNAWTYYQRTQAEKAGSLYDELERAAKAGDAAVAGRVFADMKSRYPRAMFTQQAGFLAAKTEVDKGQLDAAKADLSWVAGNADEREYRSIARLRLAGVLLDEKKYDEALRQLDSVDGASFAGLAADRRGDVLSAAGKPEEAKAAYLKSWTAMDPKVDYRRLVEAKLNALGVQPAASAASAGGVAK
ncbi:MAG: tetratricopeptide repeat protein [Pseudomonadota bacterium]|nr:tetratricopeptide repeat protein [Pseudomonadota bacterium]